MTDFIVIGGGIAGASAAFFLAEAGSVLLIERESQPGYHSTGRSAALFTENYGNAAIRAVTVASRPFFDAPPPGFAATPLLTPRGVLMVAPPGEEALFEPALAEAQRYAPTVREMSPAETLERCPALRPEWVRRVIWEPDAMDIDVHALHQGYLRGLRARGGQVVTDAELLDLERAGGQWRLETKAGRFEAPAVVNAAGAWADAVARLAGVKTVRLVPKRRTAFTFDPVGFDTHEWPMVINTSETLYFKPEAGRILVSPADETPLEPCDVQPDELDIATAAARLEEATTMQIRRVTHKWAGLRSFVSDKTLVCGEAPDAPGFFWLAGQGGYGIMTSPAMGRLCAAFVTGRDVPADIAALGLRREDLAPGRPTLL
jgi:D-arginine dehydrogenase